MKLVTIICVTLLGLSYQVNAETEASEEQTQQFQWSRTSLELVAKGDAKRGEELATKGKCSRCHGETGISEEDETPSIAGQIATYTYKQLHDYKEKLRDDRSMYKRVKKLTEQDMSDLSAWFATQTAEKMAGTKTGGKPPVLASVGDKDRFLVACNACHNPNSIKKGVQIPVIEGQKPAYFINTMTSFKEGERVNDRYKVMRSVAEKLTEDEIKELAAYYAAKPLPSE